MWDYTLWQERKRKMANKVFILGELHTAEFIPLEDQVVGKLVRLGLCDCLLLENAFNFVLDTPEKIQKAIEDGAYMISPDLYELALKYKLPVYGIDAPENIYKRKLTIREQFAIREKYMVDTIEKHRVDKNCVVIVGDTHLRTRRTRQLGPPSPLYKNYIYDPDVCIVRVNVMEREIDWGRVIPYTFTWDDATSGRMIKVKEQHNKTHRSMGRIKDKEKE